MDTPALMDAARVGFAGLAVSPATQEAALVHLEQWLAEGRFVAYRPQIVGLLEAERYGVLLDAFYRVLPFGTGGRRGTVGIGPNRFNPWTLATSVQGHAAWMRQQQPEDRLSVVIGYDVRTFRDRAGQLLNDIPTPIHGITSRAFAEIAAEVYAAADIAVYLPPADAVLSTPELSFAVRELQADGGLVISASHNPPDDNGSKFYHAHGGQMVPPYDAQVSECVTDISGIDRLSLDRARATGLVREIPSRVHDAYIDANLACSRDPEARSAHVVFTPLHGTGITTVAEVLEKAGFPTNIETAQASLDGAFPTVPFRAPNPEIPETLDIAKKTADTLGADLVMACDPDADRLGVAVRHPQPGPDAPGGWRFLSGNEIAALVCFAALRKGGPDQPIIIKTEVTSSLVTRIAEAAGARVVDHLLVGFKYIGEALHMLERKGYYGDLKGSLTDFASGLEESHGVLVSPAVRDKDAAGGALLLAELASIEKDRGRTLVDLLEDLWREHGYVHNLLMSTVMRGAEGRARIEGIQAAMRAEPPTTVGEKAVTALFDRRDPDGPFGPIQSTTDAASRDVLVWHLDNDARIILRPSGTEPKSKLYVEMSGHPDADLHSEIARVTADCHALAENFSLQMLAAVGIDLPAWALQISGLVSVENKALFAQEILPTLVQRLASPDPDEGIGEWLDVALSPCGDDARDLFAPGVMAFIKAERPANSATLLACFTR